MHGSASKKKGKFRLGTCAIGTDANESPVSGRSSIERSVSAGEGVSTQVASIEGVTIPGISTKIPSIPRILFPARWASTDVASTPGTSTDGVLGRRIATTNISVGCVRARCMSTGTSTYEVLTQCSSTIETSVGCMWVIHISSGGILHTKLGSFSEEVSCGGLFQAAGSRLGEVHGAWKDVANSN